MTPGQAIMWRRRGTARVLYYHHRLLSST